jgi:hypothetical protein
MLRSARAEQSSRRLTREVRLVGRCLGYRVVDAPEPVGAALADASSLHWELSCHDDWIVITSTG